MKIRLKRKIMAPEFMYNYAVECKWFFFLIFNLIEKE